MKQLFEIMHPEVFITVGPSYVATTAGSLPSSGSIFGSQVRLFAFSSILSPRISLVYHLLKNRHPLIDRFDALVGLDWPVAGASNTNHSSSDFQIYKSN